MSPAPVTEDMLHAYVDEQLTPAEGAAVERYLSQHPEEAERVTAYRRQREQIKAAFDNVLHEPVPDHVSARRFGLPRSPLLRVAAVVAWVAFGGLAGWMLRGQIEQSAPRPSAEAEIVERARVAHTIYSAETRRAVEVAASQEQDMIRWLSKRMNAAVRVPKLAEYGFEALGGRLLPGSQGPACQIMYQNAQGKRLTIYLARDLDRSAKPLRFSDKDAVHVVFWSDGTLAFAVSGELSNEELKRIANAVARDARTQG
jgi:anti-sigma factor RsiW